MWLDFDSVEALPQSGRAFYLFTNGTGMPVRVEDATRVIVWQARYIDAYGSVQPFDDATVDLRLRFAGHFHDEHTHLFYNRFRDYDPTLGRYLQPDPIDLAGGINLYAYPSNPVVHVDLLGLVHKKKPESIFAPDKKPPHHDIPLDKQNATQLQETCKFHADALADLQENVHAKPDRKRFRNQNAFAVAAVKGPDNKVKLVATMNDGKRSSRAKQHMKKNGIDNRTDTPPQLKRRTVKNEDGSPKMENGKKVKETVNTSDNDQPFNKNERSDHHAEQRAERFANQNGEELVAQSPSQPCCSGCRKSLGDPAKADENGVRPIDKIPPDRQGTDD